LVITVCLLEWSSISRVNKGSITMSLSKGHTVWALTTIKYNIWISTLITLLCVRQKNHEWIKHPHWDQRCVCVRPSIWFLSMFYTIVTFNQLPFSQIISIYSIHALLGASYERMTNIFRVNSHFNLVKIYQFIVS
jgi:hypothetical protein